MSSDPNKKTPRTFQCRNALWHKFEQMARELECSVDYLINDAMKQYARQRGYSTAAAHAPAPDSAPVSPGTTSLGPMPPPPAAPPPTRLSTGSGSMPLPVPPVPTGGGSGAKPLPPPPSMSASGALPRPVPPPPAPPPAASQPSFFPGTSGSSPPAGSGTSRRPPTPPPPSAQRSGPPPAPRGAPPPPMPRSMPPAAPARSTSSAPAMLGIYYLGERIAVNKDRFIIGRGKQSSDLTIKDPNVSRQHAMVEFVNGQYFIVDMGSTNGIEFNGQRVQRKIINEGDVFKVCDHELHFSYS
ncbi:MAG TPA: FHA domain-containing protein [Polyangiaceae bacterium]|nr:FHA domain-containing protein [Polyangiaceae bacterium]